jgi:hypothetical protein
MKDEEFTPMDKLEEGYWWHRARRVVVRASAY